MKKSIICLTPVFNDWESLEILLQRIELISDSLLNYEFKVVVVNDGSTETINELTSKLNILILNLKINIGHQRAIAVGLQYVFNEVKNYDYIIVLDSDGEDKPEDFLLLIQKVETHKDEKIIFAQRKKRKESTLFKIGYFFYKNLFYFLTGQKINFGNYSIIPKELVSKVVYQNNIWNHYSGSIIQSRIPFDRIQLDRGKRYKGKSKMNTSSLIIHGLSSISVYFDFLSLKILRYSIYGIVLCVLSISYILYQKLFTSNAIPGWASSLTLIIFGIILQLFSVTLIVLLLQLSSRKNITTPDANIYLKFIDNKNHKNEK